MNINEQLWKEVPGFPCYEAHPIGLIRNAITGKLLSYCDCKGGNGSLNYQVCSMRDSFGTWTTQYVHRILAKTFISIPAIENENNWQVDHINHDVRNNDVRNLRWLPAKLNWVLKESTRPEVARKRILEYYETHDIDYDYFDLLSEL